MGKLILSMMMTVDGFVAGTNNELDWVTWEEEMDRDAAELIKSVDVMMVGYGAYKDMAEYWPAALHKPASESEGKFAELINEKPKIVISQTKEELLWKSDELLIIDNLAEQVSALKESKENVVFYGGAGCAQSLVAAGVVDEYRLLVSPVALGAGKGLFSKLSSPLALQEPTVKRYKSGAMLLHYQAVN